MTAAETPLKIDQHAPYLKQEETHDLHHSVPEVNHNTVHFNTESQMAKKHNNNNKKTQQQQQQQKNTPLQTYGSYFFFFLFALSYIRYKWHNQLQGK